MNERLLIRGGTVLTMARGDEPRRADVLVDGGRIAQVAPGIEADARVVDATDCIVMPGFVDAHRHTWQTQLRGITHARTLKEYIVSIRLQSATQYEAEDVYVGNLAGMLEALDAGVTSVIDFSHNIPTRGHAEAAIEGTREAGIRSLFAFGLNAPPNSDADFATLEERAAYVEELRNGTFAGSGGLVTLGVSLSDALAVGPDAVLAEVRAAHTLGLAVTLHGCCVKLPEPFSEVELLERAGLLGPYTWVHMGFATDAELRRVAETGGNVASTPESEVQMAMGHPAWARFIAAGGEPSLGVDIVSNHSGCLFAQMRLALQCQRLLDADRRLEENRMPDTLDTPTDAVLRAATVGGAKALALDSELGTLEAGKQADVIAIRTDALNTSPLNDAVGTVVLHANPSNVDTVLVAGHLRKEGGRLDADLDAVRRRVRDSQARIREGVERAGGLFPAIDLGF